MLAQRTAKQASYRMVAIGASTGGTEAIEQVLTALPADGPGVVIAQHIPRQFSGTFAARLNRVTHWEVREALDGVTVRDGMALVAPGDRHMQVVLDGDRWRVRLDNGPKIWHQRPAVDVLFESVAEQAAPCAVGVLLTGMGEDGAAGLRKMRDAGCWTIAQDEASCVVFGMPRAAIEAEAACEVVSLQRMAAAIDAQARGVGSNLAWK
jgi:two-component system chemotaxis response regulator CheB